MGICSLLFCLQRSNRFCFKIITFNIDKNEICKLKAQLDRDGTTSGIPTSKTPINKDAHASKDAKGIEEDGILPNLSKDTYLIRTYTETCKRNGVDKFEALYRPMSGNPYTLAEIIEKEKVLKHESC